LDNFSRNKYLLMVNAIHPTTKVVGVLARVSLPRRKTGSSYKIK